jgi:nitroimidazol reductase NimA-like FMN-containing flavoprotein (pyridoxamine 5'-phosphate oxidase superfamily)
MRRDDRQIKQNDALDILNCAEYGILSTVDSNNQPYGVPLNFCVVHNRVYFHCATVGKKIDNIFYNSKVSFCVVGNTCVLPDKFGTKYESTIVTGLAKEVYDSEKQAALEGLLKKYSREYFEEGLKYIESLSEKMRVFGISIESISGKSHGIRA